MVKEAGEGIRGGREAKLRSASQLFAFAAAVVVVIIVENAGGLERKKTKSDGGGVGP